MRAVYRQLHRLRQTVLRLWSYGYSPSSTLEAKGPMVLNTRHHSRLHANPSHTVQRS